MSVSKRNGYIVNEHEYDGMVLAGRFSAASLERVRQFQYRADDILISTYPKCGTTWMQQIVCLILDKTGDKPAHALSLEIRSPFIELELGQHKGVEKMANLPSPRILKSHLPVRYFQQCLDKESSVKVLAVMRNVKDCLVSFYYFLRMNKNLANFEGTFDDVFEMFQNKTLVFGDYFDHVLEWWQQRSNPNVLVTFYEDMKKDPSEAVQKVAAFLGRTLKEDDIADIVRQSSFTHMQKNPLVNREDGHGFEAKVAKFIRKGEVGDWKSYFTSAQNAYIDKLCAEKLQGTGLSIPFEL